MIFLVFRRVSSKELQLCWGFRAVVFCVVSKESPIASVLKVLTTFLIVLIMLTYYLSFSSYFGFDFRLFLVVSLHCGCRVGWVVVRPWAYACGSKDPDFNLNFEFSRFLRVQKASRYLILPGWSDNLSNLSQSKLKDHGVQKYNLLFFGENHVEKWDLGMNFGTP